MTYHKPYDEPGLNDFYNMMFADDVRLLSPEVYTVPPFDVLVNTQSSPSQLQAVADDQSLESRVRLMAHNRLRGLGRITAQPALYGVVIEVPQEKGLDTLAVYADARARYINQVGSPVIIEDRSDLIAGEVRQVMVAALAVVTGMAAFQGSRPPPPPRDNIRITLLASDGPHIIEASTDDVTKHLPTSAIMQAALGLLERIVSLAGAEQH